MPADYKKHSVWNRSNRYFWIFNSVFLPTKWSTMNYRWPAPHNKTRGVFCSWISDCKEWENPIQELAPSRFAMWTFVYLFIQQMWNVLKSLNDSKLMFIILCLLHWKGKSILLKEIFQWWLFYSILDIYCCCISCNVCLNINRMNLNNDT